MNTLCRIGRQTEKSRQKNLCAIIFLRLCFCPKSLRGWKANVWEPRNTRRTRKNLCCCWWSSIEAIGNAGNLFNDESCKFMGAMFEVYLAERLDTCVPEGGYGSYWRILSRCTIQSFPSIGISAILLASCAHACSNSWRVNLAFSRITAIPE